MKTFGLATALLLGCLTATPAAAAVVVTCPALQGSTTYDSMANLVGDPFFGGRWSNARNTSAYIQRILKAPATIHGLYIHAGGSDVSSDGSRILVRARLKSTGTWKTLLDLREVVIERDFSYGTPRRIGPISTTFDPIEVTGLRIDMTGHGWFDLRNAMFLTTGCSD